MGVGGMRSGRKFDFLVSALKRNVEPGKERVDVWRVKVRTTLRKRRVGKSLQSSRVQLREKGAENERSSFFAVRRSICCGKLRIRQNAVVR